MLKKIIAIILVLICLMPSAHASDHRLDEMDLETLIELQNDVREEIAKRLAKASTNICTGVYEVGASLDAGNYIVILASYRDEYTGELLVFENRLSYNDYYTYLPKHDPILYLQDIPENEPIHLTLVDGEILLIGYGDWVIQKID